MALFTDEPLTAPSRRDRRSLAERIGWSALTVAIVVGILFALMPSPYVIEQPGPVYDTLGVAENADDEEVPLIEIPDETTYPTDGELNLLTVSVLGRPGQTPNWLEVLAAWFDRTRSVMPVESIFPPGISNEDRDAQNEAAMVDSQQDAIAAALAELGYEFPREVTVAGLLEGSPADGIIEDGDVIVSLDGTEVHSIRELQDAVREHGSDAPAQIELLRDGAPLTVEVTPISRNGVAVLGVGVRMHYEFPIDVELQLDNVGGPSAGMMFALGIVDKLTPGAMTGGEIVAGTGTIDSAGDVGAIGGIRQKLWGAERAGADWFLAPEANCDEVTGNVPDGITVFAVSTLDQARVIVEDLADGTVTGSYASCPAA
ncbi:PDZ domain-containing protein [Agromyces badenianii]|uniref:YlbL family protein n=1 Tax=Agromyces badenianii TaxID=2080742 RepID=UPI000D590FCB|nr:PDZ domain-containing protein [Agromyces badenianii]PWC03046.1 ATP-dependent serine peptidase containing a PDZ domain protein [Agromyces badenianii]